MGDSLSVGRLQEDKKIIENPAKESEKITKAREKLEQRLKNQDEKVTKENLNNKIQQIHDRIARQSEQRVYVTKNSFSLFDNNQNPAKSSSKVDKFAEKIFLTKTVDQAEKTENSLKNRTIEAQ